MTRGEMPVKIDDYKQYWNEIVLPDLQDAIDHPDDIRAAWHCANSLFHMCDWLYWGGQMYIDRHFTYLDQQQNAVAVANEKDFAKAIRDICPDFELIRGIANAAKHLQLRSRGTHPASPIHAANTVSQATGHGQGGYGQGPYGGTQRVMLEGPGGQDLEFSDIAKQTRDCWIRICQQHNIPLS